MIGDTARAQLLLRSTSSCARKVVTLSFSLYVVTHCKIVTWCLPDHQHRVKLSCKLRICKELPDVTHLNGNLKLIVIFSIKQQSFYLFTIVSGIISFGMLLYV